MSHSPKKSRKSTKQRNHVNLQNNVHVNLQNNVHVNLLVKQNLKLQQISNNVPVDVP